MDRAIEVRKNSYCPISNFSVGAALSTYEGNIFVGTNIEEAGFNSTIHAEQSAVAQMVSKVGKQNISFIVVVGPMLTDKPPCSPCGHCRQLLNEFTDGSMKVISAWPNGQVRLETTLADLLPHAFRL